MELSICGVYSNIYDPAYLRCFGNCYFLGQRRTTWMANIYWVNRNQQAIKKAHSIYFCLSPHITGGPIQVVGMDIPYQFCINRWISWFMGCSHLWYTFSPSWVAVWFLEWCEKRSVWIWFVGNVHCGTHRVLYWHSRLFVIVIFIVLFNFKYTINDKIRINTH